MVIKSTIKRSQSLSFKWLRFKKNKVQSYLFRITKIKSQNERKERKVQRQTLAETKQLKGINLIREIQKTTRDEKIEIDEFKVDETALIEEKISKIKELSP